MIVEIEEIITENDTRKLPPLQRYAHRGGGTLLASRMERDEMSLEGLNAKHMNILEARIFLKSESAELGSCAESCEACKKARAYEVGEWMR